MLSLIIPVLIVGAILSRAYGSTNDAVVEEWATAHALVLNPTNRPMVEWYLRTARVLRTWGVVAGLVLPQLVDNAFGWRALREAQPLFAFVGYLLGALYAELALVRRVDGDRRVAVLEPRDVEAYVPRRLLVAHRAVAGLALGSAAVLLALPWRDHVTSPTRGSVVFVALLTAGLGLGLPRLERWLVERPQPFTDADLLAADDAIRSQSLHSVAGSGLAVQLLLLGGLLFGLTVTDVQLLRWTMWVPGLACFVGSIYVCLFYGHRAWRVRRSQSPTAAA
jgi:hypothetical protein